jgi:FixJ family two-component response regulator
VGRAERVVGKVQKRQIFVVENDEAVRASIRTLLEAERFLVRDFPNAEAFLDAWDGHCGDCIVLGHRLSGMSGLDLVTLLRSKGLTISAIMVAGNGAPLQQRAANAGILAVLSMPLIAEALLGWLEQLFPDGA